MQKKKIFRNVVFSLLFLSGCTITSSPLVKEMVDLRSVYEGMSQEDVKDRLGEKVLTGYDFSNTKKNSPTPIVLKNPYRQETFKTEYKTYDVAYYLTAIKKQDGIISDHELTPLVFENNRLIGQGWVFWDRLKKEQQLSR